MTPHLHCSCIRVVATVADIDANGLVCGTDEAAGANTGGDGARGGGGKCAWEANLVYRGDAEILPVRSKLDWWRN